MARLLKTALQANGRPVNFRHRSLESVPLTRDQFLAKICVQQNWTCFWLAGLGVQGFDTSFSREKEVLGGDPAAPSGTATLLRLHPNY